MSKAARAKWLAKVRARGGCYVCGGPRDRKDRARCEGCRGRQAEAYKKGKKA